MQCSPFAIPSIGNAIVLVHHCERQTRIDAPAIDHHRTRAAGALIAALFGSGKSRVIANRIQQRYARLDRQRSVEAVDVDRGDETRHRRRARRITRM